MYRKFQFLFIRKYSSNAALTRATEFMCAVINFNNLMPKVTIYKRAISIYLSIECQIMLFLN